MAVFKKSPESRDSEPIEAFGVGPEALGAFAATYWPVVLGGITLFLLIALGKERTAIPVGIAVVVLQAWMLGLFG